MPDFETGGGAMTDPAAAPVDGTAPPTDAGAAAAPAKPTKPAALPPRTTGYTFEDRDITAPPSSKYTTHVKDDKRKQPEVKVPGKGSGNKLAEIGPDVKVDDGSGTNPPTAKKGSDE
jgi:hypothetical protein